MVKLCFYDQYLANYGSFGAKKINRGATLIRDVRVCTTAANNTSPLYCTHRCQNHEYAIFIIFIEIILIRIKL